MLKILHNYTIFDEKKRQNKYNFVLRKRVLNKNIIVDEEIINY